MGEHGKKNSEHGDNLLAQFAGSMCGICLPLLLNSSMMALKQAKKIAADGINVCAHRTNDLPCAAMAAALARSSAPVGA